MSANAILNINANVGGLVKLDSLVNLLGKAKDLVVGFAKDAEGFHQAMTRATISIADADSRTGGLIDTMALYTQTNKLAMAGMRLTEKQYGDIAVASVKMAQATGQDATQAFTKLTEQISRGTTESLMEYGVQVKASGDKMKDAQVAVEALSARFADQSAEAETLSEGLFALKNNAGTTIGVLLGGAAQGLGLVGALNKVNSALGEMNTFLATPASSAFFSTFWDKIWNMANATEYLGRAVGGLKDMIFGDLTFDGFLKGLLTETNVGKLSIMAAAEAPAATLAEPSGGAFGNMGAVGGGRRRGGGAKSSSSSADDAAAQRDTITDDLLANGFADQADMSFFDGFGQQGLRDAESALQFLDIERQQMEIRGSLLETDEQRIAYALERADLLQREIDTRMEYIAELGYDPESIEYQLEMIEVERLRSEQAIESRVREVEQANAWRGAWSSALSTVGGEMRIAQGVTGMFETSVRAAVMTIASGSGSIAKAVKEAVRAHALQIGIQSTIDGLKATADAAIEAVQSWGASPRVGGFASAAGLAFGTAAVAFGIAGVAGIGSAKKEAAKPIVPQTDTYAAAPASGGRSSQQSVDVRVGIDEQTGDLYTYVREEGDTRARTGRL